ncbi:phage tail assembly chaperone [Sphingomonas sp. LT1P40]|uniref:phage tail assembly chaperone n=1 Tax=Alteristakelama amylovorans TaxID=3096166 RepID=UPI002FCA308C
MSCFAEAATRLAGQAGVVFGWMPDVFWAATPAELLALVTVLAGDEVAPPDAATLARMREAFPDG